MWENSYQMYPWQPPWHHYALAPCRPGEHSCYLASAWAGRMLVDACSSSAPGWSPWHWSARSWNPGKYSDEQGGHEDTSEYLHPSRHVIPGSSVGDSSWEIIRSSAANILVHLPVRPGIGLGQVLECSVVRCSWVESWCSVLWRIIKRIAGYNCSSMKVCWEYEWVPCNPVHCCKGLWFPPCPQLPQVILRLIKLTWEVAIKINIVCILPP